MKATTYFLQICEVTWKEHATSAFGRLGRNCLERYDEIFRKLVESSRGSTYFELM